MDALASLIERLPAGTVTTHHGERQARARDRWALALLREARGERVPPPIAVVFPPSTKEVAAVMAWASETGTAVVPRGGGSGVCGGAEAVKGSVVLDLSRMHRVLAVDPVSQVVEVEAGIRGERLEAALEAHGLTVGHYPQSMALSTVGGWIAASSAGQASAGYGTIEDLVLGTTLVLGDGTVARLRPVPRSAAGPDLRRLLVGSEGTLGIVTEAVLSCARRPSSYEWHAFGLPSFDAALTLARQVTQSDLAPLVLRAYDEADAALTFGPIGHAGGCVAILGFGSDQPGLADRGRLAGRLAHDLGASPLPPHYGEHWWEHRNDAVELYRSIMENRSWGSGVVVDTMEVAALWGYLPRLYRQVRAALLRYSDAAGCHLSHPYRSGASLYFTFLVRGPDDHEVETRYLRAWEDAARACLAAGGTMTHHHGVGLLKRPFMEEELGEGGLALLRRVKAALDPTGILNPGKLLP